jgi:hypothetical protein
VCPDDETIPDASLLYRRVTRHHLFWDEEKSCCRVSSGFYRGLDLSVVIGARLEELGRNPESTLDNHPEEALVSFEAGIARSVAQAVCRAPEDDEDAHGLCFGKKTSGAIKALHRASIWVVPPEQPCASPLGC